MRTACAGRLFRKTDILIALAVLVLAAALLCTPALREQDTGHLLVEIRCADDTLYLPLDTDGARTLESNGHTLTVCVRDGAAFIESSSCPDGICLRMGRISRAGEEILCAKAALSVRIVTSGEEALDGRAQ